MTQNEMMVYEKQAEVAQAIAHPIRLAVLDVLRGGEQCVCDIAEAVGSERSNLSRHLSVMVAAGVLDSRKEGLKVFYRLKCPCILDFFSCITKVLRQQVRDHEKILRRLD
jgi:DNA-binding transcriptional ArsR family regulator